VPVLIAVPWSIGHEGGSKVKVAGCLPLMSKQYLTRVVGSILKDEFPRGDEDGLWAYGAVGRSMPQNAHPAAFAEQATPQNRAWHGFRPRFMTMSSRRHAWHRCVS
jgi:hypothetical protein